MHKTFWPSLEWLILVACSAHQPVIGLSGQGAACSDWSGTLLAAESQRRGAPLLGAPVRPQVTWEGPLCTDMYWAPVHVRRWADRPLNSGPLSQHLAVGLSFWKSKPGQPLLPGAPSALE